MSKKFYIVVPLFISESAGKAGITSGLKSLFSPTKSIKKLSEEEFELYRGQIMQRAELVFGGLIGLGLRTRILEKDELVNIFYTLYNPSANQTTPTGNKMQ